jgi:hypothetical protein
MRGKTRLVSVEITVASQERGDARKDGAREMDGIGRLEVEMRTDLRCLLQDGLRNVEKPDLLAGEEAFVQCQERDVAGAERLHAALQACESRREQKPTGAA